MRIWCIAHPLLGGKKLVVIVKKGASLTSSGHTLKGVSGGDQN